MSERPSRDPPDSSRQTVPGSPLLARNFEQVLARLRSAEQRAGRAPGQCQLLAVVKRRSNEAAAALRALGQRQMAENRVQALDERPLEQFAGVEWHLVGQLQTNKVRRAVRGQGGHPGFSCIHSVDRPRLAEALEEQARSAERRLRVYLQVNIGGEPQKAGISPKDAASLAERIGAGSWLDVQGLMAMAPQVERPEDARPYFAALRELGERLRTEGALPEDAAGLSMGMSGDFEVAAEEGATVVRVGSALFATPTS